MKKIVLYTDGACSGNPGIGGYAAILQYKNKEKVISGGEKETTNNRMELLGVISGLEALKEHCEVEIYSDSAYVVNAFLEDWITFWIMNNWRTKGKKEVLNIDLWKRLVELTHIHKITWNKVKGHADNELNNRCDEIARKEIEKIKEKENKKTEWPSFLFVIYEVFIDKFIYWRRLFFPFLFCFNCTLSWRRFDFNFKHRWVDHRFIDSEWNSIGTIFIFGIVCCVFLWSFNWQLVLFDIFCDSFAENIRYSHVKLRKAISSFIGDCVKFFMFNIFGFVYKIHIIEFNYHWHTFHISNPVVFQRAHFQNRVFC